MSDLSRGGITTRKYKSGSIVFFEGDKSENVYILKSGKVILTYSKPETGEEIKEEVRLGEFFGVKSAVGKYPREETAQTIGETVVLVLSLHDFEKLVLGNINVVKKMLSVFSNQLRRIGKAVREVLGETNAVDPAVELFKIGEYYYSNGMLPAAKYVFKRYLEHYPDEKFASQAMRRIKEIDSGNIVQVVPEKPASKKAQPVQSDLDFDQGPTDDLSSMDDMDVMDNVSMDMDEDDSKEDMMDFDFETSSSSSHLDNDDSYSSGSALSTELADEMSSFLSKDDDLPPVNEESGIEDDFGLESPGDKFNNAVRLKENRDYSGAAAIFEEIINDSSVEINDGDLFEMSHVELGKCYSDLGKYKEALVVLSNFTKNNPNSGRLKRALMEMGDIYLKAGNNNKALPYYKKVMSMPPRDEITQEAMRKLKELNA